MDPNDRVRPYFQENENLNSKVQTYLSKKPEWWVSALQAVGFKPTSQTKEAQTLLQEVALHGSNLELLANQLESQLEAVSTNYNELNNSYVALKEDANSKIEDYKSRQVTLENQLNEVRSIVDHTNLEFGAYKARVQAGVLLEGKDAEMYKKFKEQMDKIQELGKDAEKGFQKTYGKVESHFRKAWDELFGKKE